MKRRSAMLALGLIGGSALARIAHGCRLFPPNSTDRYRALQNQQDVGFQSISFLHDGPEFVVSTHQDFRYLNSTEKTVGYTHTAREVWIAGWLNKFESTTRHGEQNFHVTAETVDDVTMLVRSSASQIPSLVTGYVVPGNVWHRDARLVSRLMDLVDGRLKLVRVFYAGKDVLSAGGEARVADHYRLRGEMNLDAWYTDDCQLARMLLPFRDAEPVVFNLT